MEKNSTRPAKRRTTADVTRMMLVTGLYMAVTLVLSVFSFGVIQIRLLEMFNYLSLYNRRYIVVATVEVALTNTTSSLGLVDAAIGSASALFILPASYKITSCIKNIEVKTVVTACVSAFSMFTVAGRLTVLYQLPFLLNWWATALGELASMIVGGIIIYRIGKEMGLPE